MDLLDWASTQGHILNGGGRLQKASLPGRDFPDDGSELPHYHKKKGVLEVGKAFRQWISEGRRSKECVGVWCRPLFCGGWSESTTVDTSVFNLQTQSIFIDMRFPVELHKIQFPKSFQACSLEELRLLSRQHCFAGYSLISNRIETSKESTVPDISLPYCVRHHAIDWNYHPDYPRNRPNKWFIQRRADGKSFKEWCIVSDPENGQAVYMERWELLENPNHNCFVARRVFSQEEERDSFLVIIGDHFGYTRDRRSSLPKFRTKSGGCASLVDEAYSRKDRDSMIAMLDLEGSYGRVSGENNRAKWTITHSTFPWKRNTSLITYDSVVLNYLGDKLTTIHWEGAKWEVLENDFSKVTLQEMFGISPQFTSKL
eukprot:m.283732 g.283732  ORF g.283732 m.283732 type:complete len:371 (-) comp16338_c2_seq99:2072-3184(-)